uniref:DNA-(apurinic or apyrimidinic site) lyase n=1 Tax=Elaeophora elaphi TaxID=1147741 RepID=A0A0R3RY90_9BILA
MPLLKCSKEELNLGAVLLSGQSFSFNLFITIMNDRKLHIIACVFCIFVNDVFCGVAKHRVWKIWRENDEYLRYEVLAKFSKASGSDLDLNIELVPLYKFWVENDKYFAHLLENHRTKLEGIRVLGQDPLETVFVFICSANNHIRRITNMVETLCELYGESTSVPCSNGIKTFYDFADLKRMTGDPALEAVLRVRGFGYRALNVALASKALKNNGEQFLENLSKGTYEKAVEELQQIRGIGAKVADCICLMGLRMHSVVPIDTHTLQITAENYLKTLPQRKFLLGKHRQQIAAVWREKFGPYAGWAQAVLFAAHLRQMNIRQSAKKRLSKIKAVKP